MALPTGITFEKGKNAVTGVRELDRNLAKLTKTGSKKAVRSGMTAGLSPVVTALRSETSSITGKASTKSAIRKSVGKSVKIKDGLPIAKVGFGIGKKRKVKGQFIKLPDRGTSPGVGIHPAFNVHWVILGVGNRSTGKAKKPRRHDETGKSTGTTDEKFEAHQLPVKALEKSKGKVFKLFADKVEKVIANEIRKAKG